MKETNQLKEDSATNGPQGTVSKKTRDYVELLLNAVNSLIKNTTSVNQEYKDNIDWQTLLTTQIENLHAVSHFTHGTFSVLQRTVRSETTKDKAGALPRQCMQSQRLMLLQGYTFQMTRSTKRPLPPLRSALLSPM